MSIGDKIIFSSAHTANEGKPHLKAGLSHIKVVNVIPCHLILAWCVFATLTTFINSYDIVLFMFLSCIY